MRKQTVERGFALESWSFIFLRTQYSPNLKKNFYFCFTPETLHGIWFPHKHRIRHIEASCLQVMFTFYSAGNLLGARVKGLSFQLQFSILKVRLYYSKVLWHGIQHPFLFFLQNCFDYSVSSTFPYKLQNYLVNFLNEPTRVLVVITLNSQQRKINI